MERISCLDGEKYKELKVKEGVYVPDLAVNFPDDDPFRRMVKVEVVRDLKFDETYPYLDESSDYKRNVFICDLKTYLCNFLNWMIYGLKVENKHVLDGKDFSNGAITVANHQYRWDVPGVRKAVGYRRLWIPAWADTFKTSDYFNLRGARCIPIPDNMGGIKKFNEAFDILHERKEWFHIFPEGVRWDFYKPFKPFRKGAFNWAYKYDMPIIPMVYVHRERTGWRKLFAKGEPLMTLKVLEPMYADKSLPRKAAVDKLRKEVYEKMLDAAGIIHNPWPMIPEVDN